MNAVAAALAAAAARRTTDLCVLSHSGPAEPADLIEAGGFEVERGVAGPDTGFAASQGAGELTIALRTEYDALSELGHAGGHNIIAASSTGAVPALREIADRLDLTIKLLGTPAEESGGGKTLLPERGVFKEVAMAMMVHPAPQETCACSSLAIADPRLRYPGTTAHAATAPHKGRTAANALAQVAVSLPGQHLAPGRQLHGLVSHGGAAPNAVPTNTSALDYLRATDVESPQQLETRVLPCFEAGAVATRCTHEVTQVSPGYTQLVPDSWLAAGYRATITGLGRSPLSPEDERQLQIGSTDTGNVSPSLPAIHPTIAIDCSDAVNHQPEFAAACVTPSADRAVRDGALALALTGLVAATDDAQRDRLIGGVSWRHLASADPVGGAV